MNTEKLLKRILTNTKNVKFDEFVLLVETFGFVLDRTKGSHNIFKREGINELTNIQNYKGEVKSYQTKQFLSLIEKYDLKQEVKK